MQLLPAPERAASGRVANTKQSSHTRWYKVARQRSNTLVSLERPDLLPEPSIMVDGPLIEFVHRHPILIWRVLGRRIDYVIGLICDATSQVIDFIGDPYGTRTRVFAVRGRRPRPLDEGAGGSAKRGL